MTHQPNSMEARDIAYQLHSYTDARKHQQDGPLVIERGEGGEMVLVIATTRYGSLRK